MSFLTSKVIRTRRSLPITDRRSLRPTILTPIAPKDPPPEPPGPPTPFDDEDQVDADRLRPIASAVKIIDPVDDHDHGPTEAVRDGRDRDPTASAREKNGDEGGEGDRVLGAVYGYGEAFWSVVAIVSYLVDLGSDVFVAFMYYSMGEWWYFGLTVGFAVVSSLTVMTVSLTWYDQDAALMTTRRRPSRRTRVLRVVLHVLQLGPVLRYFDAMHYGIRSRRKNRKPDSKDWYQEKVEEDADASLLRLFECYLEAAPQLTLQLYIILVNGFLEPLYLAVGQSVSCVSSLFSIAWALTAYHSALRFSLPDKSNMMNKSIAMMFFWRLFGVTARVLALALFASMYGFNVSFVVGFHFVVTLFWLLSQDTKMCLSSRCKEVVFVVVIAMLCTFDYFNVMEGRTRLRYLLFNVLVFIENIVMLLVFLFVDPLVVPRDHFVICTLMVLVLVLHVVAVATQVLYYLVFHPNNSSRQSRIQPCVPLLDICHCRQASDVQL